MEQTTITWHYLPTLPPEPEGGRERHIIATTLDGICAGWYKGKGRWTFWGGSEVYAWAEWPTAPPVRNAG